MKQQLNIPARQQGQTAKLMDSMCLDLSEMKKFWQSEFGDPLRGMYVSIDLSFSG